MMHKCLTCGAIGNNPIGHHRMTHIAIPDSPNAVQIELRRSALDIPPKLHIACDGPWETVSDDAVTDPGPIRFAGYAL